MDNSSYLRLYLMLLVIFIVSFLQAAFAGLPRPYDKADHYWPLDKSTGIRDVITNTTGIRDGKDKSLYFQGPGTGYLFIKRSRLKFGSYRGTCVVDPSRCSTYLTVSLWVKYNKKINFPYKSQFLIGTSSQSAGTPGFAIHASPISGSEERVRFQINNRHKEWRGYTTVEHNTWTQIGFTWSNSSGLVIHKNCERISSFTISRFKNFTANTGDYVYLVKAPGRGKASFNISYDDVAVWYKELRQVDKGLICSRKVGPPALFNRCVSGDTWISVQWNPSLPVYGIFTGYIVWYQYLSSKTWVQRATGSINNTYNITGLVPSSTIEIQIQNKIHGGNGQSSERIICNTMLSNKGTVLESPQNLTVEATSSRAILISWKPSSTSNSTVKGYWVLYKDNSSKGDFTKFDVGLPLNNQFLIIRLSTNTSYKIYVVAVGLPPYAPSKPSELNAATDSDESNTVSSISSIPINLRTLKLKWRPPPHPNRRYWYKVFMKWTKGNINQIKEIYSGRSTSYKHVSSQDLPFPQECIVMIMPPGLVSVAVNNLTVQSVSWNSAVVTWSRTNSDEASDIIDTYRIVISSSSKTITSVIYKPYVSIVGLSQMTSYRVNVQQGNSKGFGPLLDQNVVFRTADADECASLDNSCDKSDALIFDENQCISSVLQCNPNSLCINTEGSFFCKCNKGFIGDGWQCQEIPSGTKKMDFCNKEISQEIQWGRTLRGQEEKSPCPKGVTGIARRQCGGPAGQPAVWSIPDLSDCVSKWALDMNDMANDPSVSSSSVADQTANLTDVEQADKIYPGDLKVVVNVLGVLSQRENIRNETNGDKETNEFTKSAVDTASNILDSKTIGKWIYIPQEERKVKAGALLSTLDSVALTMARSGNRSRVTTRNVVVDVFSTSNMTSEDIVIGPRKRTAGSLNPYAVFPSSELSKGPQHVTYISYSTIGSLLAPQSQGNTSVESSVVSLTVSDPKRKVFSEPVMIVFSHKERGVENTNSSCVFWDTTSKPSHWSRDGCVVNSTNSSHTVCHCYHLTSFAVLMNVKGDTSLLIQGRHKLALTLITYIGVVLSVIALCLTFVTFLTFRFLKSSRTFIHTNLAFALILAQLLFLFGINKTKIKLACQIIAGALHYTWLASFVWMALEGVMLYLMLVKVFGTKTMTRKKRIIFLTVGWCFPLLVVGISAGLHPQGYGTEYYCWLSIDHGFIWAFVGPALLVIGFNFLMMGVTFSVMSRRGGHRRKPSKIRRIRYWAKACTLLTCILGLTWLFGVFYINHETLFMAYFFTIFNSIQGVFIFLFHCIGDEKIRHEYARILCCRDKGPAYTIASNSKTPKSDDYCSGGKLLKSVDKSETKNYTNSTGTVSSDGHKPVLVMYQKRSSFGARGSFHREEVKTVSG